MMNEEMNDTGCPDGPILTEESTPETLVKKGRKLDIDSDGAERSRQVISPLRRNMTLFLCFIECFLLAGAFWGWAALVYVFVADGIYSHLCPEAPPSNSTISGTALPNGTNQSQIREEHPTCNAQDEMISVAFTFGIAAFGLISFPAGMFFDKYGLMPSRLIASALGIISFLSLAFANKDLPWLIFPGSILLAMASVIILMANTHVALLAGRNTSLVMALYVAAIHSSGATFLIIKLVYDAGIPRIYSLSCHAFVWLLVIIVTIAVLPRHKVLPREHTKTLASSSTQETNNESESKDNFGGRKKKTLKQCIFSPLYVIFVYWFEASSIGICTYFGRFNPRLNQIFPSDTKKVSHFTNMLSYAQASSLLISPIAGLLMDWARKTIKKRGVRGEASAIACIVPICLTTFVIFLWNLTSIVTDETAIYISIFLTECARNSFFPTAFAFLELIWPLEYYGSLFGLALLIFGVGSMMQFPYIIWMQKYGIFQLDLFLVVISVTAAVFPIYIVARHFRRRRAAETTVFMSTRM